MVLLTPGPTPIPDRIRAALSEQVIPHRSDEFRELYADCADALSACFKTQGESLTFAASGTSAMESAMLSLLREGDTVVTCSAGRFGERWQRLVERASWLGLTNVKVSQPWGESADPARLAQSLKRQGKAELIVIVHSETSTGALSDIKALAQTARAHTPDALILVDAVSSAFAAELDMDSWGVDAAVTASQKALALPPGLGIVALGERALARLDGPGAPMPQTCDLRWHLGAHREGSVAATPPVNHYFALRESLAMIDEEGLDARLARVARQAQATRDAMTAMGLRLVAASPSPSVTSVWYPDGVGEELRDACRQRHDVRLGGGQDRFAEAIFRIGHMGSVTDADIIAGVEAIADELKRAGAEGVDAKAGVAAIRDALAAKPVTKPAAKAVKAR